MSEKKVLIIQGGWDGHEPKLTSRRFASLMEKHGYTCTITDTLDTLADLDMLMSLDLIVACWTMGTIDRKYSQNVSKAVGSGVGLAGCHGGMCDAFRNDTEWQFMTGGQWVSHPGGDGIDYMVNIRHGSSPIVEGLEDFPVCSSGNDSFPGGELLPCFQQTHRYAGGMDENVGQRPRVLQFSRPSRRCIRKISQR